MSDKKFSEMTDKEIWNDLGYTISDPLPHSRRRQWSNPDSAFERAVDKIFERINERPCCKMARKFFYIRMKDGTRKNISYCPHCGRYLKIV